MNNIDPQAVHQGVQRVETRGGERTDARSNPQVRDGNSQAVQPSGRIENKRSDDVVNAVARLNDYIQTVQRDLEFRLDESTGRSIITVVDRNSSEVIRQIPTEVTLSLAEKLNNEEPLLLFSALV